MPRIPSLAARVRTVLNDERGGITVLALFLFTTSLIAGGLALDVTRAQATVALMQNTADNAAHAALLRRTENLSEAEARQAAIEMTLRNMPAAEHGLSLAEEDIKFGVWNGMQGFIEVPGSVEAVRVMVKRRTDAGNPLPTMLLKLVGMNHWDITRVATITSFDPGCLREGFVAEYLVDMQSNSSYTEGFCLHSNDRVKISSNNYFEDGVSVSMPNPSRIDLPNSGFSSNPGLEDALNANRYNLRIIERLDEIMAGLTDPNSGYIPAYITNYSVLSFNPRDRVNASSVTQGRIHRATCTNNGSKLTIEQNAVLENVVIVTNCEISIGNGARLENVALATTDTGAKSITGAHVQVGRNDNCGTGGGAQMLTMGGIDFPQGFKVFGGQLLAKGSISFTADAGGVQGAAFVAGNTVAGTSNMNLVGCGGRGMEDSFRIKSARLVE